MNGAETYLEQMRYNAGRRTVLLFMLYTLSAFLSCILACHVFSRWDTGCVWQIIPHTGSRFFSAALAQSPTAALLTVRFLTSFTVFSRAVSVLLAVLRGAGIGCAAAFMHRGMLNLPSGGWMTFAAASLLVMLLFCALSDVYADCFLTLSGLHETRMRASLFKEYLKLSGIISGVILLSGIAAALLIS